MLFYALLARYPDGQLFWGPVDWLQHCGVAFLGENREEGFVDDLELDPASNPAWACILSSAWPVVRGWTSVVWTSGSMRRQPDKERDKHRYWRSAGYPLEKRPCGVSARPGEQDAAR